MEIFNTTTGKVENLSIIDLKSGLEWSSDLLGNHEALSSFNEDMEMYEMNDDDIKWWKNTINGLEKIDELEQEARELLSSEDYEALKFKLAEEGNVNDYDSHIPALLRILEEVIAENK